MKTLQLTPAELKMIEIAREKEALAKAEAAAKKAMQLEKDIQAKEAEIAKLLKEYQAQNQAAKTYFASFPKGAELVELKKSKEFRITGEYTNPEDPSANDYKREVLWTKTVDYIDCQILFKSNVIYVREHIVYSSSWSSRGTSKGFKMSINSDDKKYTRVATVVTKIEDEIKEKQAAAKEKEAKKNALQNTVDAFTKEYPDAKITTDYGYGKTWKRGAMHTNYDDRYDIVKVEFCYGVNVSYRVYGDGSLSRLSINIPNIKPTIEAQFGLLDLLQSMDAMSNIAK